MAEAGWPGGLIMWVEGESCWLPTPADEATWGEMKALYR